MSPACLPSDISSQKWASEIGPAMPDYRYLVVCVLSIPRNSMAINKNLMYLPFYIIGLRMLVIFQFAYQ